MAAGSLALDTGIRAAHSVNAVFAAPICESEARRYRGMDPLIRRSDLPGRVYDFRMCVLTRSEKYSVLRWGLPKGSGAAVSSSYLSFAGQFAV